MSEQPYQEQDLCLMGLFNTLTAEAACPNCGHHAVFEVQFKYGNTWQFWYSLGDRLAWGGNDKGRPGYKRVLVEAISHNPCPHCGLDGMEFDIIVEDDRITALLPEGITREIGSSEGYVVEQER